MSTVIRNSHNRRRLSLAIQSVGDLQARITTTLSTHFCPQLHKTRLNVHAILVNSVFSTPVFFLSLFPVAQTSGARLTWRWKPCRPWASCWERRPPGGGGLRPASMTWRAYTLLPGKFRSRAIPLRIFALSFFRSTTTKELLLSHIAGVFFFFKDDKYFAKKAR